MYISIRNLINTTEARACVLVRASSGRVWVFSMARALVELGHNPWLGKVPKVSITF